MQSQASLSSRSQGARQAMAQRLAPDGMAAIRALGKADGWDDAREHVLDSVVSGLAPVLGRFMRSARFEPGATGSVAQAVLDFAHVATGGVTGGGEEERPLGWHREGGEATARDGPSMQPATLGGPWPDWRIR